MGFHRILSKCDDALAAYIIAGGAGRSDDTFSARRSLEKPVPCTICFSHTAKVLPEAPFSGVMLVEAFIEVRTSGLVGENQSEDAPKKAAIDRTSDTFDLFYAGGDGGDDTAGQKLGEAITRIGGVEDFTILQAKVVEENQGFNPRVAKQQGNAWVDTIHLELVCCPGNVL